MRQHVRVPTLNNLDVVIRLAKSEEEVRLVNRLVVQNYVDEGFWEDDELQLKTNKFLHAASRTVFVVFQKESFIGTMSIIVDSSIGLPSDATQSTLVNKFRNDGEQLAEISCFAMNRDVTSNRKLVLFLMSFVLQYCFYHAGLDRIVASCSPDHANYYESALCFTKISDLTYYDYSHASGYLISLDLWQAHHLLSEKYPANPTTGESYYRFLMRDPQPCHQFPPTARLKRLRNADGLGLVRRKVA